ncbi:ArsR family transcriptional regulator [Brachybacterium phenoliresistens]|uniref:ArsR family transcriptional regulator n=1 Tax=Brachybacterium phenoliresistens TaxID=396014 RepID=Z9JXS1_9MICO|nr:helix-turn-helix domain-containing protein [Brachybacterium phenoliresistens]EWS82567.1 ArsR family transcriptional regulator [Brachybacterium phenoliresistens]
MDRKVVEFHLAPGDVSAVRFGISPGHELVHAVRVLLRPQTVPLQWGWFRSLEEHRPQEALRLIAVISGIDGYMPDFLTSTPSGDMTPDDELARLREVPDELLRIDLAKMLDRSTGVRHEEIRALREDPPRARARIAAAWEEAWEALLAPVWPQMLRLLRADIGVRVRRIGERGLGEMASTLHSSVTWADGTVSVRMRLHEEVVDCGGTGLVLVPSVMHSGRGCSVLTQRPAQPTIFYPAHGFTETWYRDDGAALEALSALLGRARAQLILELQQPLTTTECAALADLAISTASHHLHVLREAGLVDSRRSGQSVLHARTPLGEALANGR